MYCWFVLRNWISGGNITLKLNLKCEMWWEVKQTVIIRYQWLYILICLSRIFQGDVGRYNVIEINQLFHIKLNIFTSSLSLDNGMLCVLRYTVMIMIKGKVYNTEQNTCIHTVDNSFYKQPTGTVCLNTVKPALVTTSIKK